MAVGLDSARKKVRYGGGLLLHCSPSLHHVQACTRSLEPNAHYGVRLECWTLPRATRVRGSRSNPLSMALGRARGTRVLAPSALRPGARWQAAG